MQRKLLLDSRLLQITVSRLCQQLIENHGDFDNTVIIGLQPRGIFFAGRIKNQLESDLNKSVPFGFLDITFYRDDFRKKDAPIIANSTNVPFDIEDKKVILIDDVLYTGRSIRSAMDAMNAFGRPSKVELLVLVNRKYSRDLPIEPNYVGKTVNTLHTQRVLVELIEQGFEKDNIWLTYKEE